MSKPMILLDPLMSGKPEILALIGAGKHRAVLAHMFALIYVSQHATDGFLPKRALKIVHGRKTDADALVAAGLWFAVSGGWGIYEWAENQLYRPREPISKVKRRMVFARDGWACRECGATDRLSIDHIVAWVNGGTNDIENLQTLCISCNSRKRDK